MSQIAKDLLEQLASELPKLPTPPLDAQERRVAVGRVLDSVVHHLGGRVHANVAQGVVTVCVDQTPIVEIKERDLRVAMRAQHTGNPAFEPVQRLRFDKPTGAFVADPREGQWEDATDVVVREIVGRIRAWMPR